MSYSPVPAASTDIPAQSQPQIYANFVAIQTAFNLNHGDFNGADEGKHKFVQLTQQAAKPTISATEMALYQKDVSGTPQMFIERGNGTEIDITSAAATANGWARLPSGILLKWGQATGISTGANVLFPTGASIPVFSTIFHVWLTPLAAGGISVIATNVSGFETTTGFFVTLLNPVTSATGPYSVNYLAIGI